MAQVQILNKEKSIDIIAGDEKIGEIRFNPDDIRIYTKFVAIVERLMTGSKDIKRMDVDESELDILDKNLETLDDFEQVSSVLSKLGKAGTMSEELWDGVCNELDEIFGTGVCECFTKGAVDPDLLAPLIDTVTPYFKKARKDKTDKYRATQNDVL